MSGFEIRKFCVQGFHNLKFKLLTWLEEMTELTECHIRRFPNGKVDLNKAKCHREHPSGH